MVAGRVQRREHFWDSVRAFLMLLGIPYHVALSYRAGKGWIVNSGEGIEAFSYVAQIIHLFRMPAFFLIAGYFAALLLAKREPETWLNSRITRLGVPLIVSLVTLVPIMNLFAELSNFALPEALASWGRNSASSGGYWVRHLWFIIVLLYCSAAVAALARWRPSLRRAVIAPRIDHWVARHFTRSLLACAVAMGLWQAVAVELFYIGGLATNIPQQILRLDELIMFAPWFALGCVVARSPRTLERMTRLSPDIAMIALNAMLVSMLFMDEMWAPVGRFVSTIAAVTLTQTVIAAARRFLDRPIPMVQRLVPASFVIYLFHMPILVALIWAGKSLGMPVTLKALSVMLLTLVLSYGAWAVIARSPLLSFLFNGEPIRSPQLRQQLA
ncbi:MAG: acyltransferase family protein [Sphingobium sp.]